MIWALLIGLGAPLSALAFYAAWIEPAWRLRVARYKLTFPKWGNRPPLRIVIISDLHAGGPHVPASRVRRITRKANRLQPDLGVLLGDYAAAHPFTVGMLSKQKIIDSLGEFSAPKGVYSVLGNHDWWQDQSAINEGRLPEAGQVLQNSNFPLLENHAVRIGDDDNGFWLVGLADQRPISLDPEIDGFDDMDAAMANVTDDAPAILLAHEPDIFPDIPKQILLTLSGHTHGGQIRIGNMSPVIMVAESEKYGYGEYWADDQALIVSGGIGCSDYPVRFGCPPEITVVEISGS